MTTFQLFQCTCGQGVLLRCTSTFTLIGKEGKEKHYIYTSVCPNCSRYIKQYIGKETNDHE